MHTIDLKIEAKRRELYERSKHLSLTSSEIIEASQKLDKLINRMYANPASNK